MGRGDRGEERGVGLREMPHLRPKEEEEEEKKKKTALATEHAQFPAQAL